MRPCSCCLKSNFTKDEVYFTLPNSSVVCGQCVDIMSKKLKTESINHSIGQIKTSKQVLNLLNRYVISQGAAKEAVSVAISHHLSRIQNKDLKYKSNLLIYGPTGSGKTEIARALRELSVPVIEFNCASLSPTGYIGDSASSLVDALYYRSGMDAGLCEKGIVFLDEFDKLISGDSVSVSKKSVQQEFLKIIEGTDVTIKLDGGYKTVTINTSNILFIAAGAFFDLEQIVKKNFNKCISLANDAGVKNNTKWQESVSQEHFIEYGLIPELIGRFPIVSYVEKLAADDYLKILTIAENSIISELVKVAKIRNIDIEFSDSILKKWAEKASRMVTGARGLRGEIELSTRQIFLNEEYYSGKSVLIDSSGIVEKKQMLNVVAAS